MGDASIPFSSFIGALARNKVPITVDDWRDVSSTHKKNLWTLVLLRYKHDEMYKDYVFQKMATSLREYRCQVGSVVVKTLKMDEAEIARKLAMIKPENLTDNQWSEFIKKRTSVKFQAKSVHEASEGKTYSSTHDESIRICKKQENHGEEVTRAMLWTKGKNSTIQ